MARIWALAGKPLQIKVKQAYQNFYVYGAVEPRPGENFSLFLPWVNTEMMNLYLEQMSHAYESDKIVVIMDQAGWHKSKELVVPDNIEILYLREAITVETYGSGRYVGKMYVLDPQIVEDWRK